MKVMKLSSLICVLLLYPSIAVAWPRFGFEDETVVERSELIIVGHIKADTLTFSEYATGVTHAKLVVTEVLKGQYDDKELPIVIHYGLTPIVGGYLKQKGRMIDVRGFNNDYPKDNIEIYDTASGPARLMEDARQDAIWFLRKRIGTLGREPENGDYGIADPQDLSRLEWKEYYLCYLSKNSADAVRKYAAEHPKGATRAKRYLDHLEVQEILKIKDPKERSEKLLPFFASRATWNMKFEAEDGILSCGKVGAEELKRLFSDPQYSRPRNDILDLWGKMEYKEAVPLVIELLKKHDQFWAEQRLEVGWWHKDSESEQSRRRRAVYGEVYHGVCLLRKLPDPSAREVLELTRNRWRDFENSEILNECNAALRGY